jgi:hypothetical protein
VPRAALIVTAGLTLSVACLVGAAGGSASGVLGAVAPPTSTTVVAAAPPTTAAVLSGGAVPTTVLATTTVPRGGAAEGSIAKPEAAEGWSIERIVTLTALGIVALAAAGYAFGRIRSSPPIHPDLMRNSD